MYNTLKKAAREVVCLTKPSIADILRQYGYLMDVELWWDENRIGIVQSICKDMFPSIAAGTRNRL
jgi:hypothetical protein